ncbi:acyltransferase-domain-containing protein [Piedraia hortae CBS 480.64]|uniref:Acyltransferase-domain-containing protein n=1 Tax=Piedraia hortae CBS 480.64 TaxID=1314780 RepID=A0A6A7C734_9PEZI|nr:acyltransferase-domain-containing protein [Piedraia hortae CBS 480.64]
MAPSSTATSRAGLSLTKSGVNNPNPIQHGSMGQAERAFSAASTFLSGLLAISASQIIGAPLKMVDAKSYDAYMAWTKESFAVLMTTITQWWAPTLVRVTGDESMQGQLYQMNDGSLRCNFPHRLVLMANHQLYTDWLYLWWIAYTNKMHGRIYIILKESLKNLPIFGWGAQFYNFIFLCRNWQTDRARFKRALDHLKDPEDPMWLLIFPEGTNLSASTREKSAAWAKKSGIPDMKHQLLPRLTGLQYCLQELRKSTNWLYDCTLAYEGIPTGQFGQDVFTLRSSLFEGRPPKSVNMYWRRFRISEIPVDNNEAFGRWLNNRWREKDYLLEYYYKFNHFPAENPTQALAATEGKRKPNHAKWITTDVRGGGWDEFLSIFGPVTTAAGALSSVDLTGPVDLESLLGKVVEQQQLEMLTHGKLSKATANPQAIKSALKAAQSTKLLPFSFINSLLQETSTPQKHMGNALHKPVAKPTARSTVSTDTPRAPSRPPKKAQSVSSIPLGGEASNTKTRTNPIAKAQKSLPLANREAAITRPLSTIAIQTAGEAVRNAAARRSKQTGTALPGQKVPGKPVPLTKANLNAASKHS